MEVTERVRDLCEPIAQDLDVVLFDVERNGATLRVTIEREGGLDLDLVAEATRRISRMLDEHDPVPGRYTLEVSSPGLERPLRTPAHFRWAIGREATIKTHPAVEGERRVSGTVTDADDDGVTIDGRRLPYADIERARTVFEWGPAPKPSASANRRR